jgi:pyrimidine operon attenuation protein/uracil phosphoribosyltransferase
MKKRDQKLTTGTISLTIDIDAWNECNLFEFAERQNPKRSFLFVSKVLGKHIPVSPTIMRQTYQRLATQITPKNTEGVLFIGMAETAVGLAAGIYEEASKNLINSKLITTTRHPINSQLLGMFKEEHSHATDHLIYNSINKETENTFSSYKTLILIDDEATTGKTFNNLILSLSTNKIINLNNIEEIMTVTLTDWSKNTLPCLSDTNIILKKVSLMSGDWCWTPKPNAILPLMPKVNISEKGKASITDRQDWGRQGMTHYNGENWLNQFSAQQGESVLVLGTNEFLYPAFLAAEKMEKQGANVLFSSTTRSPIAMGLAIKSAIAFNDNYGLGIPNYCYNVVHKTYDRIILCLETDPTYLDSALIDALSAVSKKFEIAYYD